jgi:molybdopterin-containing oxidoreductase family iron-sulfur binding subunit
VEERPWRSPEESSPRAGEFPPGASSPPDALTRRRFLELAGAAAALAGATGCVRSAEKIVPWVKRPPESTPGLPSFYATALVLDGWATGVLVECHEGRPTKIEGNPEHPASLGAAGPFEQAAILELYDPSRARSVRRGDAVESWDAFRETFGPDGDEPRLRGDRLRFLIEPTSSPLVADLLARLRAIYPGARVHVHAPLDSGGAQAATRELFGRARLVRPDLSRATRIAAFDADLLARGPFHLRHARDFADRRVPESEMARLYAIEPSLTVTGAAADHRLARRACEIQGLLGSLLARLVLDQGLRPRGLSAELDPLLERLRASKTDARFLDVLARDLARSSGRSALLVGDRQPETAHALGLLANLSLGALGGPIAVTEPVLVGSNESGGGLVDLARSIDDGEVEALVVLDGNPFHSAPADLDLARELDRVPLTAYVGLFENETARRCRWFVPAAHSLESWGDARALDGTLSLIQPAVTPLYGGRTAAEVLAALLPGRERTAYELVRDLWRRSWALEERPFEERWRASLERGVVEGTAQRSVEVRLDPAGAKRVLERALVARAEPPLEVAFAPDAAVHDGRFANNPWLLELPDPITKLTWGKAALVSPATARSRDLESGDVVEIAVGERRIRAPVFVLPGHADASVTLPLGYGREGAERHARGVGFDAYHVRRAAAVGFDAARLAKMGQRERLASTQEHGRIEGYSRSEARGAEGDPRSQNSIVRGATLDEWRRDPAFARRGDAKRLTLYEPPAKAGPQWGMAIDLSRCVGCNACVVACQAENNVPVVGVDDVLRGREMHWLRIDRSFLGPKEAPRVAFQPMLCQHCEKAPCEYVCPVNATTHSPDGLNEQTYNRCVGTRFCENNCAWKVRRFNWFDYTRRASPTETLARNPDVTVRERGVMEKCTFCVQRIREAEIRAGRPPRDGEVRTACQQACPARAIVFGDVAASSPTAALHRDGRAYEVLGELGTRPRVRYLARITNPNPELAA